MSARETPIATIDELLAQPDDGRRHELLDGRHAVTPAPTLTHQRVLLAVVDVLRRALAGRDDLEVLVIPADLALGPNTLVQPDLFVIHQEPANPARDWTEVRVPVLIVEISSPSTAARDRGEKKRIYQHAGGREYWIVDLDARLLERWTPSDDRPEIVTDRFEWSEPAGTRVALDPRDFFAPPRPPT